MNFKNVTAGYNMAAPIGKQRDRPKVGVGVLVTSKNHPNCVLLGKRKNSTGDGTYALPGGHLEFGEGWCECGARELLEETGLVLKDMRYCGVVNTVIHSDNLHYIDLFVRGEVDSAHSEEPQNQEPHKCEGWHWIDWDNLPSQDQLFCPLHLLIQQGYNPFKETNEGISSGNTNRPSVLVPNQRGRPGVGVGVLVTSPARPGCVLLGVRKGSTGSGMFALPGGHLEYGEEWCECGSREVLEETGLILKDMKYCTTVNAIGESKDYHYVTLFVRGEVDMAVSPEPQNLEPDKCEGWQWRDWGELPPLDQLFCPLQILVQQGYHPFESK
ncbi:uncharacterized protein LOC110447230 isoform X1 [Mizuhopecten yessoensis]|uniref:uncharacterized protein LOC110447230 isoform X1 n=2 Tax=Mizuhopecten yessoensis TaxID=6573 RepID=UPI000B45C4A9|nr:uncharacterized protein LOC110447230 isoform X1 [Mizuhopecten yessoensis]